MSKYLKYGLPGLTAGFVLIWLLGDLVGKHNFFALIIGSIAGANMALWIGQLLGKIKPSPPSEPGVLFPRTER